MKLFRLAASRPRPKRTHSRRVLLGVSATTFLALSVWMGPDQACFFIAIAAILTVWFWLCRRSPAVGWLTVGFIRGLTGR